MKNLIALLCIIFSCPTWIFAQNCTIGTSIGSTCTLTMDGVLTIPAGPDLTIEVKAWGAGGGSETAKNKRSGGGGGGYFTTMYTVTGGSTFSITVGQGAISSDGGDTSFDFDGGGLVVVGGGGLGTGTPGLGGTGSGAISGGDGGARESGGLNAGGGGGGSGAGNGPGGQGGNPTDGSGGIAGLAGSLGAAGGAGGNDTSIGSTSGVNGAFPGGGAGGKGTTGSIEDGAAGGNGQVIVSVTGALPVELVHFNAKAKDNHVLLEWQTGSELNNKGFELQRSEDGFVWDILEFVEGKGTIYDLSRYTCIDKSPHQALNYYRLKQLDFDGKFEYSEVVSVVVNRLDEIITYPNPVYDQLIIEGIGSEEVLVQIYNAVGEVMYRSVQFINTELEVDVSTLMAGNYYLNITNATSGARIHQQLLVKVDNK